MQAMPSGSDKDKAFLLYAATLSSGNFGDHSKLVTERFLHHRSS